jgi:hypothetical protein
MIQITKLSTPIFYFFTFVIIFSTVFSSVISQAKSDEIQVNKRDKKELTPTLDKITKVDPIKPEKSKLDQEVTNKDIFKSNQGNLDINFDLKTKKINIKDKIKGDTTINISNPNEIDSVDVVGNTIIYSGKKSKVDTMIEPIGGGFRQVINIKSSDAPSSYDFPFELLAGEKLVINADGSASVTRSFTDEEKSKNKEIFANAPKDIKVSNNFIKSVIAKPWAKDANNKDLKTSYEAVGNILRQKIDLSDAVFPVVADPAYCFSYITSVSYVWRNYYGSSQPMYEVDPNWCGKAANNPTFWAEWQEVVDKAPNNNEIKQYGTSTYWSLYNQYTCHSDWIALSNVAGVMPGTNGEYRDKYHLEAWRADKGYWGFVADKCN